MQASNERDTSTVKPLGWEYLSGFFDAVGSLSDHHTDGKGWAYRFRIPSRNRQLLEKVRNLLGTGSISKEHKPTGPYYRLEVGGLDQTRQILARLLPHLRAKRVLVKEWLRVHGGL